MSAAWGHINGVVTLLLMFTFIAIWVWAWFPMHRATFDSLSRIPMGDAEPCASADEDTKR